MNPSPSDAIDSTLVKSVNSQLPEILLARYQIISVLGAGAFGQVLEVKDLRADNQIYALKRLVGRAVHDPMAIELIRKNFKLVSPLSHPHIVTLRTLEFEPECDSVFLIMDLIRGTDLQHWLVERRKELNSDALPMEEVLGIAEQVASGLDYAHSLPNSSTGRNGILHRDLKPANIMVETGRYYRKGIPFVRIVDFGLASEIQASILSNSVVKTGAENSIAGTLVYMAPEQFKGRTLTRGVDQWALAVIMCEMISGYRPFDGPNFAAIQQNVLMANPDKPQQMSNGQWNVLKKTFQLDRRSRHRSCIALVKEFAAADRRTRNSIIAAEIPLLDEFAGVSTGPVRSSGLNVRRAVVILGCLCIILLIALVVYLPGSVNELDTGVINARKSISHTGAELASALNDAQRVRLANASRPSQQLRVLDEVIQVLKIRQEELNVREARFRNLANEVTLQKDSKSALNMLGDLEMLGRADTEKAYPDLLRNLSPSIDERRSLLEEHLAVQKRQEEAIEIARRQDDARQKALAQHAETLRKEEAVKQENDRKSVQIRDENRHALSVGITACLDAKQNNRWETISKLLPPLLELTGNADHPNRNIANNILAEALAELKKRSDMSTMLREADILYNNSRFAEAGAVYQQAFDKCPGCEDAEIAAKGVANVKMAISEARYRDYRLEGTRAAANQEWVAAYLSYKNALKERPNDEMVTMELNAAKLKNASLLITHADSIVGTDVYKALSEYKEAVFLLEGTGNDRWLQAALHRAGLHSQPDKNDRGSWEDAIAFQKKAISTKEGLQEPVDRDLGLYYGHLGWCQLPIITDKTGARRAHNPQGDWGKAMAAYQKSASIHKEIGEKREWGERLNQAAFCLIQGEAINMTPEARELFREAVKLRREAGDEEGARSSESWLR